MAEQKEDLRFFLDNRLRDIEQKIRDIEQQNLVNFRWIIAVYLGTFIPAMVAIFALILTIESNNNRRISTLQAGLEKVSVQVNLMAQSFSYKLKTSPNKPATTKEQKEAVTIETKSSDQRPKTAKLIN